jgi:long-chain acyl-CoA synthetase
MAACTHELPRGFEPQRARAALLQRDVSLFPGVPVMFDALARQSSPPGATPRLRRAYSAGSPLPRRVFDAFETTFGAPLGQIYGATEFGSVTFNDPDAPDFEPESVGRPLEGARLRVVESPGAGEAEGQLAVAAPSLLSEFLDEPPLALDDGYLLTGDLARLDARGRLFLTGRVRLLVDVGGIKVNPLEVEAVLARHPRVRDAVVVPVRVSDLTARLKAVIEPEPGRAPTKAELRRFAREHLVHYKVPRSFEIRSALPRSSAGKILRKELEAAPGS